MTPSSEPAVDPQALFAVVAAALKAQAVAEQQSRPQTATMNRLRTAKQAGEYIGRTENAVRQMVCRKQLPVVRIGHNIRIDRQDLDRMIDDYKQ